MEQQQEVRYYICTLPSGNAASFNSLIRSHWSNQNSLHWTPDVVFSEGQGKKRAVMQPGTLLFVPVWPLNVLKNDKPVKPGMKIKRHKAGRDNDYLLHLLASIKMQMRLP